MKGIIIRARASWHEDGKKSTKYYLNLEKRNHIKKHMRKLNINGSITTDPIDILSEQPRGGFYQELYMSRNKNEENSQTIESSLKDLNIPKPSEEQKVSCEGKSLQKNVHCFRKVFQTTNHLKMMEFPWNSAENSGH